MLVKTYSAAVNGLEVTTVTVEVNITRGVMFHLTGLADTAVRESKDRIVAAMSNTGFKFPISPVGLSHCFCAGTTLSCSECELLMAPRCSLLWGIALK